MVYPCVNDLILDATYITSNTSELIHKSLFFRNRKPTEMKKTNKYSTILLRTIIVLLTGLFTTQFLVAQDWYDTDWAYRIPVTITNSGSELEDYQVEVLLDDSFNWPDEDNYGADIRFTESDGINDIDFWIESWDYETSAIIWVEVPIIAASTTTTIYLYYGNASATSASNGDFTFAFFDGFDSGNNVEESKWDFNVGNNTMTSVAGGLLTMTATRLGGSMLYPRIHGTTSFNTGYVGETRARHPNQGTSNLIGEVGFIYCLSAGDWDDCIRIQDDNPVGESPTTLYWQKKTQTGTNKDAITNMVQTADQAYHIFRIYRDTDGTNVTFQIDDTDGEDDGTNIPTGSLSPFLMSYSAVSLTTNTFIVDWTRVRKWDEDADFTIGLGSEQELHRWTGGTSSVWTVDANWSTNQAPVSTSCVFIPDVEYDPEIGDLDIVIQYLKIDPSASLTLEPDGTLTINGELINNGTFNLNSTSQGMASLMVDSYSDNGTENIQLYLTGPAWHYISPPVSTLASSYFEISGTAIAMYDESLITDDEDNGWVTSTGYHYNPSTNTWVDESLDWYTLSAGIGYYYYGSSTQTITIPGTINTGDLSSISLYYNSAGAGEDDPTHQGWNLIGNPFTCGIEWDDVVDANSIWSNVESSIYFRRSGAIYTYNPGTGFTVPDDFGDGNEIPPMQGFFIKANASASLTIPESARIHTDHGRYKSNTILPLVRLQLENSDNFDQTLIVFKNEASSSFDNLYDARKLFAPDDAPYIYSLLEGTAYTINTIPLPEDSDTIPLVINASSEGQYMIKVKELEGLENYNVYLLDKDQSFAVDLSDNNSYSFASEVGKYTDRFILIVSSIVTGIHENIISDQQFNIYTSMGLINIQTLSDVWNGKKGDIKVFDMTGRLISNWGDITFHQDEVRQFPAQGESGIYIVQINSGQMRYVNKVFIK